MPSSALPAELIATNRFGLGAKPGEISAARSDPKGWLMAQLSRPQDVLIQDALLNSSETNIIDYFQRIGELKAIRKSGRLDPSKMKDILSSRRRSISIHYEEINARTEHGIKSNNSFLEKWVRFWSNHFTVSARTPLLSNIVGAFEREAIRPHVFGKFNVLLEEVSLHPAMLIFLDNNYSLGPNSPVGQRLKKSYNENLAREILELHTVGIDGGYNIDDIISFAKTLTGWTVALSPKSPRQGKAYFRKRSHEPGFQIIMGQTFSEPDGEQAKAVLRFLSTHPATARLIAKKLARYFTSDNPNQKLVRELETTFLNTKGDLLELAKALISSDISWQETGSEYKTPEEYIISISRAMGGGKAWQDEKLLPSLGQSLLKAPSPEGWEPHGQNWINAENILRRLTWAREAINHVSQSITANTIIRDALGDRLSKTSQTAITKLSSRQDQLAALFLSPEFLKR